MSDKARDEFFAEAQENLELLSRDLVRLDEGRAQGRFDPEALNEAFRAVHSVKGLAGLFGVASIGDLSHHLENLLDGLRLGRSKLTAEVLDLLFEAVAVFNKIIRHEADPTAPAPPALGELLSRLDQAGLADAPATSDPLRGFALDPAVLAVLTEYEEHRLRENVKEGRALYRVHATFALETIDRGLDELKTALRPLGETIAFLPSADGGSSTEIDLDVIFASSEELVAITAALAEKKCTVSAIPRAIASEGAPAQTSALPANVVREREQDEPLEASLRSVAQTVRVDIRKLDSLMNLVGELGNVRAGLDEVLDILRRDRTSLALARTMHREMRALER